MNDYQIKVLSKSIQIREITPSLILNDHTLIFLHEGLGSIDQWKDFPEIIAEKSGCKTILYDRFGYGKSDKFIKPRTKNYLHEEAEKILPIIIEELSLDKIILIGHSDGGSIALIHGANEKYQKKLSGIITMAAHVFVEKITLDGIKDAVKIAESTDLLKKLEKYHGDKTHDMFWAWVNTWLSPEFESWNIENLLSQIKTPLLIIQGEKDEYGSQKQVDTIHQLSSGNSIAKMITHCAHIPHLQAKPVVIEEILDFIKNSI